MPESEVRRVRGARQVRLPKWVRYAAGPTALAVFLAGTTYELAQHAGPGGCGSGKDTSIFVPGQSLVGMSGTISGGPDGGEVSFNKLGLDVNVKVSANGRRALVVDQSGRDHCSTSTPFVPRDGQDGTAVFRLQDGKTLGIVSDSGEISNISALLPSTPQTSSLPPVIQWI